MAGRQGAPTSDATVVDDLLAHIQGAAVVDDREVVESFAKFYLRRLPESDIPDLSTEELLAEVQDLLGFIRQRDPSEELVRVFAPTIEGCGYAADGSVLQVNCDDSPFLVDSISAAAGRLGYEVMRHLHPVIGAVRSDDGYLDEVVSARGAALRESVQHLELAERLDATASDELDAVVRGVLRDVRSSVRDLEALRQATQTMISGAKSSANHYDYEEVAETVAFLDWLLDDNFVFLGYREYGIDETPDGTAVKAFDETGLGILSGNGSEPSLILLDDLPPHLRDRYTGGDLLVVTKTNRHATVHRDARMDYIGLRRLGPDGRMRVEMRMLGLFTSKAYMTPASEIPVLRQKLSRVVADQDVIEGSHDYKSIIQLFETFPKDDLFAMNVADISDTLGELVETEDSSAVRLFVRSDSLNRFVSVLVTVPRDRFNADLRKEMQDLFIGVFGGTAIDYRLAIGESGDARIHFSVWIEEGTEPDVDLVDLEQAVISMARNWDDRVIERLRGTVGEAEARELGERWTRLFPDYYKASTGLDVAAGDIQNLERLASSSRDILVGLQNEGEGTKAPAAASKVTRITIYRTSGKLNLSTMMPLMEHLGIVVVEEVPTRLLNEEGTFIHDFGVLDADGLQLDVEQVSDRISTAIESVLAGETETDSLNRLLVSTGLSHDELAILRAYRSYWLLLGSTFSSHYVDDTFAAHPELAEMLIRLFQARFSTDDKSNEEPGLVKQVKKAINAVESLDEDRILRGFLGLILATERTSLHVEGRTSLALKFSSANVPGMPEPRPMYEIFVHARDVEGVHLRGGMVARGGIRWSDRREDYRTEVLGLMKAQMTKNVVIVPTGAKGGFVVKRSEEPGRPTYDEVSGCYQIFIRGLLDVTDNRVGDAVVPPSDVRRHDDDDPYLVVAADKGTASLSDTANGIAGEYGFWLDDAFASGGSAGYDHKALGITAKGAWESVRRHFLDLGIDVDTDEITAVGVGDMSGDVFGNGMLISPHLKLIGAFDHRHIFVDPAPDTEVSWNERKRISLLARSSWADYDASLISRGGGVFARKAKSIEVTDEMRSALTTDAVTVTPNELIKLILKAPVDLLWNGGIGTYVKSRAETNGIVQDRSNDPVRVDGRELRCRVAGEGGNLGFTQLGRIEFEEAGGRVFADFIDNSGGVHASDREVNLKILLRMAERAERISRDERDTIIESVSSDVVEAILYDNFLQAQIVTQEAASSPYAIEAYADLMDRLEREGLLNREIEFLPSAEEMAQRAREGKGMTRPEISVLLAYAKMSLTEHLGLSHLPDDPHFVRDLLGYFPKAIVDRFEEEILEHPLRRELIATIVANQVLNSQGSTYYSRMRTLTGASAGMIVRCYRIARAITRAPDRWADVEALGTSVPSDITRAMLRDIDRLVTLVSRLYLERPPDLSIDEEIEIAADDFATLAAGFPVANPPEWREPYEAVARELVTQGVPEDLATRHAFQRALRRAPDTISLAHSFELDVLEVAEIYNTASQVLSIGWLERQIRLLPGATSFDRLAIESLRGDLRELRRDVVAMILDSGARSFDEYLASHDRVMPRVERWRSWIAADGIQDVSAGLIASRRLRQILI